MNTLYLILYILAAVCFIVAAVGSGRPWASRVNLIALGLFFWVLVPLIQTIKAM